MLGSTSPRQFGITYIAMRRTVSKYVALLIAVGAGVNALSAISGLSSGDVSGNLLKLLVCGLIAWAAFRRYRKMRTYEQQTYDWYIKMHPPGTSKRPACRKCGSDYMRTRRLMRRTYTQEHSCGTCV